MNRRLRTLPLLLAVLVLPAPAMAAVDPALEPLAFLAGHCWKGTIPGTPDTDEHCFSWIYDGKYLRDRHVVRRGDKAVYEGESTYYWNSAAKQVEYFYVTAAGGHAHGRMVLEGALLTFPASTLISGGQSYGFRAQWKRAGDDGYEVLREYQAEQKWVPVTVQMKKVAR
jgi:hypothetical protein